METAFLHTVYNQRDGFFENFQLDVADFLEKVSRSFKVRNLKDVKKSCWGDFLAKLSGGHVMMISVCR